MLMKRGICYGVSVGPGDPELITRKALEVINSSDVIFLPTYPKENCKVYQIIKGALPEISESKYICIDTKGMADPSLQADRYDTLACEVKKYLDDGKSVAFPALGEVSLYSTFFYVHERLISDGYMCETLSGVSSVQEIANRVGISLAQGDEEIHIFPNTEKLDERLCMPGTKVFMKPKGNFSETIGIIKEYVNEHTYANAYGVSNCGTDKETIATCADELDRLSGYMTVLIVKESGRK